MTDSKDIWIKTGYECFALLGQSGLKIEPLSKKVGKNKSSFYHYFVDLDLYIDELLLYHIKQSYIIAEHKTDILFNRQLRINRSNKKLDACLEKSNEIIGNGFVVLWVKELDLKVTQKQVESIFELALENFYLQVNDDNLNHQWLVLLGKHLN